MAYTPFFKDRLVEFPGRITLTNVLTAEEATFDMVRAEGAITNPGTLLNAANMDYGTTRGYIQLDTTATAIDSPDKILYDALVALNWANDCIE